MTKLTVVPFRHPTNAHASIATSWQFTFSARDCAGYRHRQFPGLLMIFYDAHLRQMLAMNDALHDFAAPRDSLP